MGEAAGQPPRPEENSGLRLCEWNSHLVIMTTETQTQKQKNHLISFWVIQGAEI